MLCIVYRVTIVFHNFWIKNTNATESKKAVNTFWNEVIKLKNCCHSERVASRNKLKRRQFHLHNSEYTLWKHRATENT